VSNSFADSRYQAIIRHHSLAVIGDTPYFHSLW
jgi:hypothetical protein